MFKVMRSGKRQKKQWKRMLTKVTFVGGAFTRKPPKYERFIRPTGAIDGSLWLPSCQTRPSSHIPLSAGRCCSGRSASTQSRRQRQALSRAVIAPPSKLRVSF